eukprot:TRINITY_DN7206_c0_g2_i1.p1 TRINITY_DN7206_c0_g2~~TRINITY_DN7206_c0_g2_i1.p1  ORF type:complete len:111 (+),score=17.71 TRINITY_DN7206_c0_g2_i1:62-394(+)
MAAATKFSSHYLKLQKRLASSLFKCSPRRVWLDPEKKETIAQARTREDIRNLIAEEIIIYKPTIRGKWRNKIQNMSRTHPKVLKIKQRQGTNDSTGSVQFSSDETQEIQK